MSIDQGTPMEPWRYDGTKKAFHVYSAVVTTKTSASSTHVRKKPNQTRPSSSTPGPPGSGPDPRPRLLSFFPAIAARRSGPCHANTTFWGESRYRKSFVRCDRDVHSTHSIRSSSPSALMCTLFVTYQYYHSHPVISYLAFSNSPKHGSCLYPASIWICICIIYHLLHAPRRKFPPDEKGRLLVRKRGLRTKEGVTWVVNSADGR